MTWEGAERTAYGFLGMSSAQFWEETPREFALRLDGYTKRQETEARDRWEQTRILAYYVAAPHLKQSMTITKFFPLPWDDEAREKNRPKLTEEQVQKLLKKLG